MPIKRKSIVANNPLEKIGQRLKGLPGDDLAVERKKTQEPKKLFAYKLPVSLGIKFKLYCHACGKTAEETLQEILTEYLRDKKIDSLI